jgi:hypothetical protein
VDPEVDDVVEADLLVAVQNLDGPRDRGAVDDARGKRLLRDCEGTKGNTF